MAAHLFGALGEQDIGFGAMVDNRDQHRRVPQVRPHDQVAQVGVEPVIAVVGIRCDAVLAGSALPKIVRRKRLGCDGIHVRRSAASASRPA
jgi:hypothetical protein